MVEHDPNWPRAFETLRTRVAAALGDLVVAIEHVGSTSVPGLAAKPIVDLDVVVRTAANVPTAIERLATIGYVHLGDLGIPGREAFNRPSDATDGSPLPAHNLYVCAADGEELRRHLVFRDYLRCHPEAVSEYAAIKRQGARLFPGDRDAYQEHKDATVRDILRRAIQWRRANGVTSV